MKSLIKVVLVLCAFCTFSFAQENKQTVAIYMSGKEPSGAKGAHKILGAELAKEISGSDNYSAVDRTAYILEQINKELVYQQRSGAVSDGQMRKIGEQLGVQFICVMQISEVKGGSYLLEARIVDVETAEVLKSVHERSDLRNAIEMQYVARNIALQIVNKDIGFQSYFEALNKVLETSMSLGYGGGKYKGSMCDFNKRTNVIIDLGDNGNNGYYIGEIIRYSAFDLYMDGFGMEISGLGKYVSNSDSCIIYVGNYSKSKKSGIGSCYGSYGNLIYKGNFSDDKPTDKYPTPNANVSKYKLMLTALMGGGYYIGEWEDCGNKECKEMHATGYGAYINPNGDIDIGFTYKNGSQFTKIPYNFEPDLEQCLGTLEEHTTTAPPSPSSFSQPESSSSSYIQDDAPSQTTTSFLSSSSYSSSSEYSRSTRYYDDKRVRLGVKWDVSYHNIEYDYGEDYEIGYDYGWGLQVFGFVLSLPITKRITIEPEIGYRLNFYWNDDFSFNEQLITIPIMLRLNMFPPPYFSVYVEGGAQIAFPFLTEITEADGYSLNESMGADRASFDFGYIWGGGITFKLGKNWIMLIGYRNITNITNFDVYDEWKSRLFQHQLYVTVM